jgi:hypothetical protein
LRNIFLLDQRPYFKIKIRYKYEELLHVSKYEISDIIQNLINSNNINTKYYVKLLMADNKYSHAYLRMNRILTRGHNNYAITTSNMFYKYMIELIDPKITDTIIDPFSGLSNLLSHTVHYLNAKYDNINWIHHGKKYYRF